MKIPYKLNNTQCLTPCPNGSTSKVYSVSCKRCEHYVTTDIENLIVECDFDPNYSISTPVCFNGNTFHLSVEAGCLNLVLTDKEKEEWFIVGINKNGELELYSELSEDLGLNIDSKGTIKTISV